MSYDVIKGLIRTAASHPPPQVSLQKCVDQLKHADYAEFKADAEDATHLMNIVNTMTTPTMEDAVVFQLIADIAKFECNRVLFCEETFIANLVGFLDSEFCDVCVQTIRCVCNLSAEQEQVCEMFLQHNGVEKIMNKASSVAEQDNDEWNNVIPNACACIRNLVTSKEVLLDEFLRHDAVDVLWKYVEKFYQSNAFITKFALAGIGALAESENGLKKLEDGGILEKLSAVMKGFSDEIFKGLLDDVLTGFAGQENTRLALCKAGYVDHLCGFVENRPNFHDNQLTDDVMKESADAVVMLSSGEESFDVIQKNETGFLSRISSWVTSPNPHIQVSAGLILGNYARSEETCKEIMAQKIHENLINVMREQMNVQSQQQEQQEEATTVDTTANKSLNDRLQSFASCLRNLTIPVENKPLLIQSGLHLLAVDLIKNPSLGVQYKGLGILRLLVQGNSEIVDSIMKNELLLTRICELSETSCVTGVPAEAQRLMAVLLKFAQLEDTLRKAITSLGIFKPVVKLLASEHTLMQNEGLVGLIIAVANVSECLVQLKECEALTKVVKLMKDSSSQTQTLFNCITFVQAVSSLDGGLTELMSHEVRDVVDNLKNSPAEIIRSKCEETLTLLS